MEYNVGGLVRIVSKPYKGCPFNWVGGMDEYCGKVLRIRDKYWNGKNNCNAYILDDLETGLDTSYVWCEGCFDPSGPYSDPEIPDLQVDGFEDLFF